MSWKPYNSTWLVELARDQHPDKPWLETALADYTRVKVESKAYIYFVDGVNPNAPESEWQFRENLFLYHPKEGELILDILEGNRVGGVELLSKL